jgi:hypothetical protein
MVDGRRAGSHPDEEGTEKKKEKNLIGKTCCRPGDHMFI